MNAAKWILDLIRFVSGLPEKDEEDNPEMLAPEDMTSAQRAALRAQLAREAEALARSLRGDAERPGDDQDWSEDDNTHLAAQRPGIDPDFGLT